MLSVTLSDKVGSSRLKDSPFCLPRARGVSGDLEVPLGSLALR